MLPPECLLMLPSALCAPGVWEAPRFTGHSGVGREGFPEEGC